MKPRREGYWLQYLPSGEEGKSGNRLSYLGDGFTVKERRNGSVGKTQTLDFNEYWKLFVLRDIYE